MPTIEEVRTRLWLEIRAAQAEGLRVIPKGFYYHNSHTYPVCLLGAFRVPRDEVEKDYSHPRLCIAGLLGLTENQARNLECGFEGWLHLTDDMEYYKLGEEIAKQLAVETP